MNDLAIFFGSVGGAVIGFFISHLLLIHRDKKRIEREAKALRTLLNLEILENLKLLQSHWEKLLVSEAEESNRPYPIVPQPLPPWGSEMWKSRIDLLPIALNGTELRKTFKFYNNLRNINDQLVTLAQSQLSLGFEEVSGQRDEVRIIQLFQDSEAIWIECKAKINLTLKRGNPLADA